jgi:dolichyl-phosphate-mannose--protein O-mannosyl transferase
MNDDSSGDLETPALPVSSSLLSRLKYGSFLSFETWSSLMFPIHPTIPLRLSTVDSIALIFFMSLGMITRFFKIHWPHTVVFDEVHFGNFTNWYIRGEYFHDIHPPLAKLIMAGVASYAGYKATLDFEAIPSTAKYPDMIYVALRSTPAFFGAMCVPLTYVGMRAMNARPLAAAMASFMIMSDLVLIVEARHILSDGILHFFTSLAIFAIFLFERYPSLPFLVFEGIALGCVAACKYTAGGIVLLAFIRQFDLAHLLDLRQTFGGILRSIALGVLIIVVHIGCFSVHLSVLPYRPVRHLGMPDSVRAGLVAKDHPDWNARDMAPSMLQRIIDLVIYMHKGNMQIRGNHPYSSKWYTWALATGRWVLYWTDKGKHIICMANVLLWYPAFAGLFGTAARIIATRDFGSEEAGMLYGYLLSYLPFALIPRDVFLYHYAIPLIFATLNLSLVLERGLGPEKRGFMLCVCGALAVFGFLLWCPWVYGLSTPEFDFLVWNNKWRG